MGVRTEMRKRKKESNGPDVSMEEWEETVQEENVKNAKPYSEKEKSVQTVEIQPGVRFRKTAVLVLAMFFAFVFMVGIIRTSHIVSVGASLEEALQHEEYYSLWGSQMYVQHQAAALVDTELAQESFFYNGVYDENQTIDVTHMEGGIRYTGKDPNTSYTLKNLMSMYEEGLQYQLWDLLEEAQDPLDVGFETLVAMDSTYGVTDHYVDKLGNLYAAADYSENADGEESILLEDYLKLLPFASADVDPIEEYGFILYSVVEDRLELCTSMPEGYGSLESIGWTEFGSLYMLDLTDLSERERAQIDPGEYGTRFQYLYKYGKEMETLLPESGVKLAVYALKHPADVSIYDTYKALASAIDKVGAVLGDKETDGTSLAVTEEVGADDYDVAEQTLDSVEGSSYLDGEYNEIFYWVKDMTAGTVWTNNPRWDVNTVQAVQQEIEEYSVENAGYYPYYYGTEIVTEYYKQATSTSEQMLFAADANMYGADEMQTLLSSTYGIAHAQVVVAVNPLLTTADGGFSSFAEDGQIYQRYMPNSGWYLLFMVVGAIGFCICTLVSVVQTGRRDQTTLRYAGAFGKNIPIELLLALDVICWVIYAACLASCIPSLSNHGSITSPSCVGVLVLGMIFVILLLWELLTLVCKGKSGNMLTNSLIKRSGRQIVETCKEFYRHRKVTGKLMTWLVIIFLLLLLWFCIGFFAQTTIFAIFMLVVTWVVVFILLTRKCIQKQHLKDGIHEIAGGNMEYQIDMKKLSGDELDMAWDMNNIQTGMEGAVERMMKSERMKTDLITNVSHDLKTPLTSIINYVDILKKENIEDPRIKGYIDILDQKALRLKNLTEDLMEAAKISSGNITLEWQKINLKQLLYQTNGEFEEKFAKRNLQLVCTLPEEEIHINADGRRMWRVVENLYNNAAKYAQPYSRIYVDGVLKDGKGIVVIKNVSEAPLNISADELMERFVRGDMARNTEGSGLGLEIARNLTVMQKGTFDIQLDGDLFKVILTFDAVD